MIIIELESFSARILNLLMSEGQEDGRDRRDMKSPTAVTNCLNLNRWFSTRTMVDGSLTIWIPRNDWDRVLTCNI